MKLSVLLGFLALSAALACQGAATNLVANGSFEQGQNQSGAPEAWSAAGNRAIKQRLLLDTGRDGKRCARLDCTEFNGDGPDFHAMICQTGRVSLRRGQWYRLEFWARGEGLKSGGVDVGLVNTREWNNAGLAEVFSPGKEWQRFEFLFRAGQDLPASASRLQFWHKGTGTLWLDDVVLVETPEGRQWFPQLATDSVKNFVPNSSFECGTANWGSFTYGLSTWAGNLYRLQGELDEAAAPHSRHCLKITLTPSTLPVLYFDYYQPVRRPVRRVLAANQGWFHVQPGEKLTLSAYLRADAEGVAAQLAVIEAPESLRHKQVSVGREWQRHEFTFVPTQAYLFIAIGQDLEASGRDAATLWLDAVQLERGEHATAYEPRQPVESFMETRQVTAHGTASDGAEQALSDSGMPGNIFTNAEAGLALAIRAFNNTEREQSLIGKLQVTDFFERELFAGSRELKVPPRTGTILTQAGLCQGCTGFLRATWTTTGALPQSLRCAVIAPVGPEVMDSPLAFNHAYPWDFLVRLARQAGIVWWRDWSAKWDTVEPARGKFAFTIPDAQIQRVLDLDCQVEVLLPFPSASWSTTARLDEVEKAAGRNEYLRTRLPMAYMPKDLNDFGNYAAEVARHYRQLRPRAPTHFQILNEPLFTDYSLPGKFGYTLADYLRLLDTAGRALHAADPQCRVVGGISTGLDAGLTRAFIAQGGLRLVDVFDLHMYDSPRPAESFEESFRSLEELMRANGGPKPVWITEWGCYADDDPPCVPHSVGDATMNRCRWPNERAATEHIVKFTAISFAHGVRKIFFHAGTCGTINGPDAGGVLFEYGGSPRKMYAGVAALTRLLGVPDACVKRVAADGLWAYCFRCKDCLVAIAWCEPGHSRALQPGPSVRAFDIMGNALPAGGPRLGESPVYLLGQDTDALLGSLKP